MVNLMSPGIQTPVSPGTLRQDTWMLSCRISQLCRTQVFNLHPHQVQARLVLPNRDDS